MSHSAFTRDFTDVISKTIKRSAMSRSSAPCTLRLPVMCQPPWASHTGKGCLLRAKAPRRCDNVPASGGLLPPPTIAWATRAPLPTAPRLDPVQLDATASVPGMFTYSYPSGTILNAGSHSLSHLHAHRCDRLHHRHRLDDVLCATRNPTITWSNPADQRGNTAGRQPVGCDCLVRCGWTNVIVPGISSTCPDGHDSPGRHQPEVESHFHSQSTAPTSVTCPPLR